MKSIILLALLSATSLHAEFPSPLDPLSNAQLKPARRHEPRPQRLRTPSGPAKFGDPLIGLNKAQTDAFTTGLDEFTNVEDAAGGLGPIFNNSSCISCHGVPAAGGSSTLTVTRFGHASSYFDPLTELGGSLLQSEAIDPEVQEVVPPEANLISLRQSTPLFGLGLIEAIPDAAILQLANRPKRDGIAGKVAIVTDLASGKQRVGRFGWKSQVATLLTFSADAYRNEMGITNRFFPTENSPNGDDQKLALWDKVQDPEDQVDPLTGRSDIDIVADFMRLLAPPPTLPLTPSAQAGSVLFQQIGCAICHTPMLQTGRNAIPALNLKPVALYSDLLLHDMGALGDGIAQGDAAPSEMRTAPLWGLRASAPYLHDGRAPTIDGAIRAHQGEGSNPRDRYLRLSAPQRRQLLDFLGSI